MKGDQMETPLTISMSSPDPYITLQCQDCGFTTSKEKKLVKHIRKCHGQLVIQCPWCLSSHFSSSPGALCAHKKQQHRSVRLRCFLCQFSSRSLSRWADHVTKSHPRSLSSLVGVASEFVKPKLGPASHGDVTGNVLCQPGKKEKDNIHVKSDGSSQQDLKGSSPVVKDSGPQSLLNHEQFSVSLSQFSTSKQADLRSHVALKHQDLSNTAPTSCDVRIKQLDQIMSIECPYCGISYSDINVLKQHCKSNHKKDSMYSCTVCDHQCKSFSALWSHVKTHLGDKPSADSHIMPKHTVKKTNSHSYVKFALLVVSASDAWAQLSLNDNWEKSKLTVMRTMRKQCMSSMTS
ncbi:zinc finger protein 845 [Elysia marginata]|uniref:Zinc finger protein 845 n=1 Tax=Elysia marginata TaxID=1093978 RepID=A0AAV4I503_9GAST|nr:zinc finger protein 845 [Elysia marginata]